MERRDILIVVALFVAGFALRLVGLDWGYFHGDERINDAARVLTGELVPGQHFYPPLFNYINGVALAGLFAFGKFAGWWADTGAFRNAYFTDPTVFYLTARGVTAAFGAMIAPQFYGLARVLGQGRGLACVIALLGMVAAPAVTFSYIAKGDTPLAAMSVLTILAFVLVIRKGGTRYDLLLGVAACLALSFKQSVLFLLVPLLVAHVLLLWPVLGARAYGASLGRSLLAILVLWPILNIGILLDLGNFIDYQRIQAVMSVQADASLMVGVRQWLVLALHPHWGIGWVILIAFLAYPLVVFSPLIDHSDRSLHLALWGVVMAGMAITLLIVRERQPEHLWISFFVLIQFLASFGLSEVIRKAGRGFAVAAAGVLAASGIVSLVALAGLWSQAQAVPMKQDLARYLQDTFPSARILTLLPLDVPQDAEAIAMEQVRIARLAAKYRIEMPGQAERDAVAPVGGDTLFWVPTPAVMFGLENASDEELAGMIKPHAWPLQPEEWQLAYWRELGFTVFAVSNLDYMLNETPSALFRSFWAEVASACTPVQEIAARKTLFLERDVTVFHCPAFEG